MAEKAQSQAEKDRARELARRAAHREAAKRAQAESIIVHGPVKS